MKLSDCDPISIRFYLLCDGETRTVEDGFEVTSSLESDIECWLEDYNTEFDGDWVIDDRDVYEYDSDFPIPSAFVDLNDYGKHVENIVEYGPAYKARYEDRGEFDWDDEYCGCWESESDYVEQLYNDCYEIPDHLAPYIDWEKLTRDVMMDYDSYYIDGEYHIFRA